MATYSKGWRQLKKKKQPRQQRPEHLKFLFEYVLIATPSALFFRAFFLIIARTMLNLKNALS
jgi:hypothetical protein